jgi:hypothetical protein
MSEKHSNEEVRKMRKEGIRKKIVRILTLDIDDLPKKWKYLYFLIYTFLFSLQMAIIFYVIFFLSKERPYIDILALIYFILFSILNLSYNKRFRKR